ncbi:copper chaperone PCu(A)C [Verrucosispora sp. WMMA2121]|uniref:copper chaperone PCu(A)C n=1 Tax=Verrucosispora sp. WMMA2121 TaxID=3015164 RepID=UPI0022B5F5F4|nr:copper chaperone PCu(A)C [Verrucosispora sp. WMMA2121]MCZ7421256.1 copper chaperone PCu(A)C [Verrucosispora sp. WMMA2121]
MPIVLSRRALRPAVLFTGAALIVSLAACASSGESSTTPTPSATASTVEAGALGVRDPWVKAADEGMTAAFATLVNDSDTDVTITGAASEVSPMELHEMAMADGKMVMRAKQDGVVIKAKSEYKLEPGGDHLMLMDLAKPVRAGDELTFTLTFADGRTQTFRAVAKPFTGAQESYAPGHGEPMPDMPTSHSPAP